MTSLVPIGYLDRKRDRAYKQRVIVTPAIIYCAIRSRHHILCYPITDVPLSLAHADGTPLKTKKASLTKLLESKQTSVLTNINLPSISCSIIDGGLILYEVLVQHTTSSYVDIATGLLAQVCSLQGMEIHLLLDKYKSPSIKDNERNLRCRTEEVFIITGPQQIQKQPCVKLVKKTVPLKKSFLYLC